MSFSRYVATRLLFDNPRQVTRLGVLLALISIALAVAVMEVALGVVGGFDQAVQRKLIGFVGDIQITSYLPEADDSLRPQPRNPKYLASLHRKVPNLVAASPYLQQASILQTKEGLEGIVLKGVDSLWNAAPFEAALLEGRIPRFGTPEAAEQVLISRKLAQILKLKVGDRASLFFLKNRVRARRVTVSGIYETGFAEFDAVMVYCDLSLPQRILGWETDQVQGIELHFSADAQLDSLPQLTERVDKSVLRTQRATSVLDRHADLFNWLGLQYQNVQFILVLMTGVAVVNLACAILILITERARTIGLLRALGARVAQVQQVFLWQSLALAAIGVLAGNALGLGLLALQDLTGLVQLNPESYFVRQVPVSWPWLKFFQVNAAVVIICTALMILPTWAVSHIRPTRVMKV